MSLSPLHTLIDGYPVDLAWQHLEDLARAGYDEVKAALEAAGATPEVIETVTAWRHQAVEVLLGAENSEPIENALSALKLLRIGRGRGGLAPAPKGWTTYLLDRRRRRIAAPHKTTGSRFVTRTTPKVPEPDEIGDLPHGGSILIATCDTPDLLDNDKVRWRLARLGASRPIADIVFWFDAEPDDTQRTMYSTRFGRGDRAGTAWIPKNQDIIDDLRRSLWH